MSLAESPRDAVQAQSDSRSHGRPSDRKEPSDGHHRRPFQSANQRPPTRPTGDSPLRLVDPNSVDAANVLVEVHARVGRTFASYEAAEGSHARQYQALDAISTALATHVAVEDELVFPAVGAQTGRHDAELRRQRQQDHLLDLLLVELGGMVPSDLYFDAKVQVLMMHPGLG